MSRSIHTFQKDQFQDFDSASILKGGVEVGS
jgi:hypothetical protein